MFTVSKSNMDGSPSEDVRVVHHQPWPAGASTNDVTLSEKHMPARTPSHRTGLGSGGGGARWVGAAGGRGPRGRRARARAGGGRPPRARRVAVPFPGGPRERDGGGGGAVAAGRGETAGGLRDGAVEGGVGGSGGDGAGAGPQPGRGGGSGGGPRTAKPVGGRGRRVGLGRAKCARGLAAGRTAGRAQRSGTGRRAGSAGRPPGVHGGPSAARGPPRQAGTRAGHSGGGRGASRVRRAGVPRGAAADQRVAAQPDVRGSHPHGRRRSAAIHGGAGTSRHFGPQEVVGSGPRRGRELGSGGNQDRGTSDRGAGAREENPPAECVGRVH